MKLEVLMSAECLTVVANLVFPGLRPTVYFEPRYTIYLQIILVLLTNCGIREVWEVACAEITISPVSVAALGQISDNRGLSVRFPRFVRVREDKRIEDATPSSQLAELWRKRDTTGKAKHTNEDDGDLIDADIGQSEVEEELEDDI